MSRVKNVKKNIIFGYISSAVTALVRFAVRTVFIYSLGITYLGVNGLFTNVLGVLSFAELGIGIAMNFSLYKPVAENDIGKIKSLMHLYKKAYRVIAAIVAIIGLCVLPFLDIIIKNSGNISNIRIYYLLFLVNSVISYLVIYKYGLLKADQKQYILTNLNTVFTLITSSIYIVILLVFHNFTIYLITTIALGVTSKIYINFYINNKYPYLTEKNVDKLEKKESDTIKTNIKAIVWQKLGGISVNQTDYIIISSFISIATVGILSNYNLILNTVRTFVIILFSSAVSGFGNLIALEDKEKQLRLYKVLRFTAFWIYGFCSIAFYILGTPFIILWVGSEYVLPEITWILIVAGFYISGDDACLGVLKSAGGVFKQDKWVAMLQAVINLAVSIIMVRLIGLSGVFVGTITQRIFVNLIRPFTVYKHLYNKSIITYQFTWLKYTASVLMAAVILKILSIYILSDITWFTLIIMVFCVIIIVNLLFYIVFRNSYEFNYAKDLVFKRRLKSNE